MKKLLIVLSLCVFVIGCDNMQKPVMDVIGDTVAPPEETVVEVAPSEEPSTEVTPPTEVEIHEITFDNAMSLEPGKKYRLRPIELLRSYIKSVDPDEAVLSTVYWGNVDSKGMLVERGDFPCGCT